MAEVTMAIEGTGAVEAAEALLSSPDITRGTWQPVEATRPDKVVSVIVHILSAASGEALSQQINNWYQKYQEALLAKKIDKVVLVANGKRLLLEESSLDDLRQTILNT
ncbi:hypothetical protein [Microcoleus sp. FACHB-68]|uniref:hypothetical protein n=1 Tax=Microcoleus sp. FACHB-68 TaxID=2692826 RepID=UPI0011C91D54|nr:hypothetical protein [Microcoleus sp. FACHB-68]MBD1940557.1 hypothetical protein [Microcoleus sp. FACHB-68]